ncbi:hypothetical protein [Seonamhaeicola sp. ML3]|uniref:hypothetical protein n=1 Tax=Seonamhaeicola sp. ML3 TaxID=2937786 RepID=UPI00200FC66C|nr:hypothetical protein [Seonamhaeicola sp. ML3]
MSVLVFSQKDTYKIVNIDLNNKYPHFALMSIKSNKILFTSFVTGKKGKVKKIQGMPVLQVFQGEVSETGEIINIEQLPIDPRQNIINITSTTLSPDGKYLYITSRYNYKNKPKGNFNMENFHISVGRYDKVIGWTDFKVLPFCKLRYSYAHPTLSSDGKTLYFTSNLRGGRETTKGGSDIFKVDVLGHNSFSEPKNLGKNVNSYSREMFPVITDDNVLYFSSLRAGGYGAYDIYKSTINDKGEFTKAEKLPKPLNSSKDDFSFITNNNGTSGYLVSKRLKGKGDDDIYYFIKN